MFPLSARSYILFKIALGTIIGSFTEMRNVFKYSLLILIYQLMNLFTMVSLEGI